MATGLRSKLTSYGDDEFSLFLRKAFIKGAGHTDDALARPIVGIIDTTSAFNPCHANIPSLLSSLTQGILLAGALPMPFPTISLHESFAHPTSLYLRNLMSIDTEEMIRAQPMDAVVLIGGCDKTIPAQLCGAISANVPFVQLVTGPMLTGSFEGKRVGACTDCRSYWKQYRAGVIDIEDIVRVNDELVPGAGTCGVMGTASTMACITEALGLMPLGSATAPAVSSARQRIASHTGTLAASLAASTSPIKPQDLLTKQHFSNAITVLHAIGGSTNAVVHLLAIAGRLPNVELVLDDFDKIGCTTPLLVNLKPSGSEYMEDFHRAGGVPTLLRILAPLLDLSVMTITGETLGAALASHSPSFPQQLVRPLDSPIFPSSAIAVLRGNLAPQGCVIKQAAVKVTSLLKHRGQAVVFTSTLDLAARIDQDDLDVTSESVLILQNIGPVACGMPEAGLIPIPRKLAAQGVQDMLRISDGRMSGTAEGAVVLHVAPESALGGPIGLVKDGDWVSIDVGERGITLEVSDEELELRSRRFLVKGKRPKQRGYKGLYEQSVLQADYGADFDWLRADGAQSRSAGALHHI